MTFTYKDIKLIGKPYEEWGGEEWHQEFTIAGHTFSTVVLSLIDDKYLPHVNPHELDGEGNSIKEQALYYFEWFHKEWYAGNNEIVPGVFESATFKLPLYPLDI